ncbi:hypothetical protein OAR97_08340 [Arcobacteraceae bacterium]|nr:hypothetical protein [Arcobacteraceae bacterium]
MINKKWLVSGLGSIVLASNLFSANVTAVKTSIAEEGFQLYVVAEVLKKMGHKLTITNDVDYGIHYKSQ